MKVDKNPEYMAVTTICIVNCYMAFMAWLILHEILFEHDLNVNMIYLIENHLNILIVYHTYDGLWHEGRDFLEFDGRDFFKFEGRVS